MHKTRPWIRAFKEDCTSCCVLLSPSSFYCTRAHTHSHAHALTYTHTHTRIRKHTNTHAHKLTHSHTHTLTHSHTYPHTYSYHRTYIENSTRKNTFFFHRIHAREVILHTDSKRVTRIYGPLYALVPGKALFNWGGAYTPLLLKVPVMVAIKDFL